MGYRDFDVALPSRLPNTPEPDAAEPSVPELHQAPELERDDMPQGLLIAALCLVLIVTILSWLAPFVAGTPR